MKRLLFTVTITIMVTSCTTTYNPTDPMSMMRSSYDEFSNTTWYKDKNLFVFNDPQVYVYVGDKGGYLNKRVRFTYKGSSWIFFNQINILADGYAHIIKVDYDDVKRVVLNGGGVEETYDVLLNEDIEFILKDLAKSSVAKIRFTGDVYSDFIVNNKTKQSITNTFLAIDFLYKMKIK